MPGTAAKVTITQRQQEILQAMTTSRTVSVRLAQRAQIILLAFEKKTNQQISVIVGLNPQQVSIWRKRWKANWDHLTNVQCTDTAAAARRAIETVLADLPRKGCDGKFTPEQQAAIVAIACEDPQEKSGRPLSHWTHREIAQEAIDRNLVDTISASRVGAFLKSGRSQTPPH